MSEGGAVTALLTADHRRLSALLAAAGAGDAGAYQAFRGGLLRHIGVEERVLLPALRQREVSAPMAPQLRLDHSALVAMLVPSPTPALLARLAALLAEHDPLEEGPEGLYPLVDRVVTLNEELLARIHAAPTPPLAAHFDGARAFQAIERLAARAAAGRAAP